MEFCTEQDGRRVGFVDSPAYLYADGGGTLQDFGPIATDGAVVLMREGPQRGQLIQLEAATQVTLDVPQDAPLRAFDAKDQPLDLRPAARQGNRVTLPLAGVDYWVIGA